MRLFNVANDAVERQRLINAISRERLMQKIGRRDTVEVYGKQSDWLRKSSDAIIARYEQRLREIS